MIYTDLAMKTGGFSVSLLVDGRVSNTIGIINDDCTLEITEMHTTMFGNIKRG